MFHDASRFTYEKDTFEKGPARTQVPTTTNYASDLPLFGVITEVNLPEGAMGKHHSGATASVITVSPTPSKYE